MYHWEFNSTTGSYALFDGERPMSLNPPPGHVTDDMKRIAAALNREAPGGAVDKARGAFKRIADARDHMAEHDTYPDGVECFDDWAADVADEALAALGGEVGP